jgi:hypothetical protein
MKGIIKKIIHTTLIGKWIEQIYYGFRMRLIPEKLYAKQEYRKAFGKDPDLRNPKTLNEKIVWLKLNDRTALHTQCADKFAVRDYIKEQIGDKFLVPLVFHTKNPSEVISNNISEYPVIIKTNHDSGGGIFVYDKSIINWKEVQKSLKKRMSKNYYWQSKEWQYKNIVPEIIVEKLLVDSKGNIPFDYKVHCFNGKVNMIQVDMGRGSENHYRNWYSKEWQREPYQWTILKNGKEIQSSENDLDKPINLAQMIELSETLSKPFSYVRVDWYDLDNQLFFGELTFHHDSGNRPITPVEWDLKLGKKLKLDI